MVSKGKAQTGRGRIGPAADQLTSQQREGPGRSGWLLGLSCLSPPARNPRLSPEIYLKRPAHSDDWRLDITLKKKAVRRAVRLEGRCVGVACGGRLVRRDCSVGEGRESEASLFMPFLYLVQTSLPVPITLCCLTWGCMCLILLTGLISLVSGQGSVSAMWGASVDVNGRTDG